MLMTKRTQLDTRRFTKLVKDLLLQEFLKEGEEAVCKARQIHGRLGDLLCNTAGPAFGELVMYHLSQDKKLQFLLQTSNIFPPDQTRSVH